jgi:acyl-coenzyme A thioesterase PaaI-like protein
MKTLQDNSRCFVCGKENAAGLHVTFSFDDANRSTTARFTPRQEHEGWQGVVHGGIIASLLDEAMVKLASRGGTPAVSGEIIVRFKVPASPGDDLIIRARITKDGGRLIEAEATVERGPAVIAYAAGKLVRTKA